MIPSATWLKPIFTSSAAMRMSAAMATSAPPPSACPFSAAMTGTGNAATRSRSRRTRLGHGDRVGVRADRAQLLEVAAGHEGPVAAAAQHEHGGVGVAATSVERGAELVDRREPDGVADLGPVDGDDRDAGVDLDPDARR